MPSKTKRQIREMPELDIVIPVYNRFDILARCLEALPEAFEGVRYAIVLVDNASEPQDAKRFYSAVEKWGAEKVKIIRNKQNLGFPRACNQGTMGGYSPFILFLNSDVILDKGAGTVLLNALKEDATAGVVGAKLVFPDDVAEYGIEPRVRPAGKIQHVGMFTNLHADFIHIYVGWSEDNPRVMALGRKVHAVTGACFLIRRDIFVRAGRFYEGYGQGTWEDCDLCMTVLGMGYNIIVEQKARGVHYTGATLEKYKKQFPLRENKSIFLSRWKDQLVYTEWQAW